VIANWLLNPLNIEKKRGYISLINIIHILILVMGFLFIKTRPEFKHPGIGIFFIQIYVAVTFVEGIQAKKTLIRVSGFIIASMFIEILVMLSVISRCSWKQNAISLLVLNIYLGCQLITFQEAREINFQPILFYTLNTILPKFGTYINEKHDRDQFYARMKNENDLKRFEQIIKKVLPSSIIISKGENVVFFNKETNRFFNISNISDGIDINSLLKNILIKRSELHEKNCIESESNLILNEVDVGDIPYLFKDLIKEQCLGIPNSGFEKYQDSFENQEASKRESQKKYLDIKVGKISWKEEESVIAIVTEDLAIEQMNHRITFTNRPGIKTNY
jgi:hypothetical protein